jgi:transposase
LHWRFCGYSYISSITSIHDFWNEPGQLQRAKKPISVRGLNRSCNHDLKNPVKGAADVASSKPGPFQEFCAALPKGMRPEMARLTLARKIATIVLIVWKKGVCFDSSRDSTVTD